MASKEEEEYEKTFYDDLFGEYKHSENNNSSSDFIYIKNGDKKTLPQSVVKLLELIFDKTLIDSKECKDTKSIFLSDIIKEYENNPNKILECYLKLNLKIRQVPSVSSFQKSMRGYSHPINVECEYAPIQNYVKNCNNTTHSDYNIEDVVVFRISRRGELVKYKESKDKIGNKILLFYGAPLSHYASILSRGLQMTSNQAETNFPGCKGIYFTDTIVEALKFCEIDKKKQVGIVLLAEVAIGDTYKVTGNESVTELPNGKDSVKQYGKYQYQPASYKKTISGVRVPTGKVEERNVTTVFPLNRYIVYNSNQILFHYLVQFKCVPRNEKN